MVYNEDRFEQTELIIVFISFGLITELSNSQKSESSLYSYNSKSHDKRKTRDVQRKQAQTTRKQRQSYECPTHVVGLPQRPT